MDKIDLSSIQNIIQQEQEQEPIAEAPQQTQEDAQFKTKLFQQMKKQEQPLDEKKIEKRDVQKDVKKDAKNDEIERQRLVLILRFYVLEFKDRLQDFKKTKFEKMKLEELREMRKEFDSIISAKSSMKQTQKMIMGGIQALETVALLVTPLQIQGLSKTILSDPEALDDIKHISLKHMALVDVQPEMRLTMKVFNNAMMLHNINSSGVGKQIDAKIEQVNQTYSDL